MPAFRLPHDEPFFREWNHHHGPMTRSRSRARLLSQLVGIPTDPHIPVIGVVGSKGKGSCVAAITQYLVDEGYRVGTICSPPFLDNTERIRLNGEPISLDDYASIAGALSRALDDLPTVHSTGGYLAPTGAFTLMGARFAQQAGVDVLVIEEGLGGSSDEISQFRLDTLVVTPVFLEHEGVIGSSVAEIADNLVGAGDHRTTTVVIPETQGPHARASIARLLPQAEVVTVAQPPDLGFGPLTSMNIATGYVAAALTVGTQRDELPTGKPSAATVRERASRLRLPGRSSTITHRGTHWFLDAAISADGVTSALSSAHEHEHFRSAPILVCMPDIKDVASIMDVLPRERTLAVRVHEDHLSFNYPPQWPSLRLDEALERVRGQSAVIALGTMSFAADMAAHLGLDTRTWFTSSPTTSTDSH